MTSENDKLNIPEKYRTMSVSELRSEKEKLYTQIKKESKNPGKKTDKRKGPIIFNL